MKKELSDFDIHVLNAQMYLGVALDRLKKMFSLFKHEEVRFGGGLNTMVMTRTTVEDAGVRGNLFYDDTEINTLESFHQTRLLPDGAYEVFRDTATGIAYVEKGLYRFFFTTARYEPKDREIVLGQTYKDVELRKRKTVVTQLHGGTPAIESFMKFFDGENPPQALLIVTNKGE